MSVRSKALRFAIFAGVIAAASGCALGGASTADYRDAESDSIAGQSADSNGYYGDRALDSSDAVAMEESLATPGEDSEAASMAAATSSQQLFTNDELAMDVERGAGFSRYNVNVGGVEPVVEVMALSNPSRLVVDILGKEGKANEEIPLQGDDFLKSVRVGAHSDRTRIVFDVDEALPTAAGLTHEIDTREGRLSVTFLSDQAVEPPTQVAANPYLVDQVEPSALPPAEVASDQEPVVTETIASKPVTAEPSDYAQAKNEPLLLDSLQFVKTAADSGSVRLGLNDSAAFELKRTAPSEYTLTIPGATASSRTTVPQIALKTFPGIRSARAVEQDGSVLVRMFVDANVEVEAIPQGNDILVNARTSQIARLPESRAQLQVGDQPVGTEEDVADDETRSNPTGLRSADGSKIYTGRLISLDLQDTDIDNALRIIAEVSNLNIIASDDVSGKVTLRLIDVPWDQALDVILKTNGLDQVTEGNVIRIAPVDKLRQEREALREAKRAAENLEDLTVRYVRVSYARVDEMQEQVEAVLSERGTVTADQRTNQLIIKDIDKGHQSALELIRRLDLRTPQVLLETQIVEGQRSILRDLGFQWNFTYNQGPETGNATGLNFPNSIGIGGSAGPDGNLVNFPAVFDSAGSAITAILDSADGSRSLTARLSALETERKVKVVSRPQVATVNNKTAAIKSVETVRIRLPDSGTSVATGQGATSSGGGSTAFEEIDVGIELTVTPQASPDYYVLLDINAKSSTFGSNQVDNIPSTLEREATSTILVKSSQTFALGGVYRIADQDTVEGVPFLKDIPFLGYFFRRQLVDKGDEELIFFITPHIVEGSFDPSLM